MAAANALIHTRWSLSVMEVLLENFHPTVHDLLKMSTDTKIHKFYTRHSLPTLAHGKAVILGDGAGPHMPQHAQGGPISWTLRQLLEVVSQKSWTTIM